MNLRVYFTLVAFALTAAFFFCVLPLDRSIEKRFEAINASEMRAVTQIAVEILRAKQYELSTYGELNSKDKLLGSAFIISREEGKKRLLILLESLKKKTHCDIVDIYDPLAGKTISTPLLINEKSAAELSSEKPITRLRNVGGRQALIYFSPLSFAEENIGMLAFGYYLNGSIAEEIHKAAGVEVSFGEKDYEGTPIRLTLNERKRIDTRLKIKQLPASEIRSSVRNELFLAGGGSLVVLGLLSYLLISFGFLRYLRAYMVTFNQAAENLNLGIIESPPKRKYPIREISRLFESFSTFVAALKKDQERIRQKTRIEAQGEKAAQVAHDVNGPLQALEVMVSTDQHFRVETAVHLIKRIRDVVSVVSEKAHLNEEKRAIYPIRKLIEEIVKEKLVQLGRSSRIHFSVKAEEDCLCLLQPSEFRRVLANLVDNAVQAIPGEGNVVLELSSHDGTVELKIKDDGRGISEAVLTKIGERGFSYGKKHGSGLGLWHAIETVRSWGGNLRVESKLGKGTSVILTLLRLMEIHKVGFSETVAIVVIDDDPNIHELWKKRLANRVKNYHFSNSAAFEKWYLSERNSSERFLYLFDHDLTDETKTGMDLIRKFDLFTQAILVTGREKDETLLIECAQSKLRFLRKSAIPNILIEMNTRVEE